MAGYQVLYGENGEVIIRNSMLEKDMAVQISELPDQRKGQSMNKEAGLESRILYHAGETY